MKFSPPTMIPPGEEVSSRTRRPVSYHPPSIDVVNTRHQFVFFLEVLLTAMSVYRQLLDHDHYRMFAGSTISPMSKSTASPETNRSLYSQSKKSCLRLPNAKSMNRKRPGKTYSTRSSTKTQSIETAMARKTFVSHGHLEWRSS